MCCQWIYLWMYAIPAADLYRSCWGSPRRCSLGSRELPTAKLRALAGTGKAVFDESSVTLLTLSLHHYRTHLLKVEGGAAE